MEEIRNLTWLNSLIFVQSQCVLQKVFCLSLIATQEDQEAFFK